MTEPLARLRHGPEAVPYTVRAIPLRLALATVFLNSGLARIANRATAVALFADGYRLPLLPQARSPDARRASHR